MKATLEFTLPEERYEHANACIAGDLRTALNDIRQHIRSRVKHGDISAETMRALDEIHELLPFDHLE